MDRGKKPIRSFLGSSNNKIYLDLKDIIRENVLPFLPAKSLFRFRGVCRDWKLHISGPFFAHNQSISSRAVLGFFSQTPGYLPQFISADPKSCGVPDPTLSFIPVEIDVKDSNNGLVLCQARIGDRAYYVCNPVTQQFKKIPKSTANHGSEPAAVLIFEPSRLDFEPNYKIMCPFQSEDIDDAIEFDIYSSIGGKWKVSGEICYSKKQRLVPKSGIYVDNVIYWRTTGYQMLAYDVIKDRSRLLPSYGGSYSYSYSTNTNTNTGIMAAIGGRLGVASYQQRAILITYLGNVHSNTQEMTIRSRMWQQTSRVSVGNEMTDRAVLVSAGGDVAVVQEGNKTISCHLKTGKKTNLGQGIQAGGMCVPYVNSLVYL